MFKRFNPTFPGCNVANHSKAAVQTDVKKTYGAATPSAHKAESQKKQRWDKSSRFNLSKLISLTL